MKLPEQNNAPPDSKFTLVERLHRALGPLAGGFILDFMDLVTFGPLGFYAGPLIGALIGWWITSIYRFSIPSRVLWAVLAALYCAIPGTEFIPVATLISALARFAERTTSDD